MISEWMGKYMPVYAGILLFEVVLSGHPRWCLAIWGWLSSACNVRSALFAPVVFVCQFGSSSLPSQRSPCLCRLVFLQMKRFGSSGVVDALAGTLTGGNLTNTHSPGLCPPVICFEEEMSYLAAETEPPSKIVECWEPVEAFPHCGSSN